MTNRWKVGAAALLALVSGDAAAQQREHVQARASVQDLKRLTIEELAEIDVSAAVRRPQRLTETAAAVSVVLGEDIRRSGYATLPDALRLADGLDVARLSNGAWAISARGFNISQANKMLVLVDGRSVYSPLSGGTFWDVQDTLLFDLDRIEVVRGPGGATWGANAANGVISIVSREAAATRGTAAVISAGTTEQATVGVRHGDRFGEAGSYRVYGRFRRAGGQVFAAGGDAGDPVQLGIGGFRIDSGVEGRARWTLQGDLYRGGVGAADRADTVTAGGNVLGRWTRRFSRASDLQVQAYYERSFRDIPALFTETRDTWDLDIQHTRLLGTRHSLVTGGGFRVTHADDRGPAHIVFEPREKTDGLFNIFAQDEIALRPDRVFVTLGVKAERNDFTGLEFQPTVRARWHPGGRQTVWGAVSRAVRLPIRLDTDLRIFDPGTGQLTLEGSRAFRAEQVIAYEAGYRVQPAPWLSVDLAAFSNRYDRLRSTDLTFRPEPVIVLMNRLNAATSGLEASATLQATPWWRLHTSYTHFHKTLSFDAGGPDFFNGTVEGNDPRQQAAVHSFLDLPRSFALDAILRGRSARPAAHTPAHAELNVRLGWVSPRVELSLVGQNLLEARNPEFFTASQAVAMRRGVYLRSVWRF